MTDFASGERQPNRARVDPLGIDTNGPAEGSRIPRKGKAVRGPTIGIGGHMAGDTAALAVARNSVLVEGRLHLFGGLAEPGIGKLELMATAAGEAPKLGVSAH